MHKQYDFLCKVLVPLFICSVFTSIGLAQSVDGWILDAPVNSVQLTSVSPRMNTTVVTFTFTNVSGKTILVFLVDTLHGSMKGLDAFTTGIGAIAPGATMSVDFGQQEIFFGNEGVRRLRVEAVVYSDGSRVGSPERLALVEDQMLGAALEAARISALLSTSPDPSIAGLDNVLAHIGPRLPTTDADAAKSLRGIKLPGVSQSYIDAHLDQPSFGLRSGLNRSRQLVVGEINNVKSLDATLMAGTTKQQRRALQARPHALSDLSAKHQLLSQFHSRYIATMKGAANGN